MTVRRYSIIVVFLAMSVYYASLMLPAVGPIFGDEAGRGYEAFLFGMSAPFERSFNSWERMVVFGIWLANPALWIAMFALLVGRYNWALCAGIIGMLLVLFAVSIYGEVLYRQPAYWFWLASFLVFCCGARMVRRRDAKRRLQARLAAALTGSLLQNTRTA